MAILEQDRTSQVKAIEADFGFRSGYDPVAAAVAENLSRQTPPGEWVLVSGEIPQQQTCKPLRLVVLNDNGSLYLSLGIMEDCTSQQSFYSQRMGAFDNRQARLVTEDEYQLLLRNSARQAQAAPASNQPAQNTFTSSTSENYTQPVRSSGDEAGLAELAGVIVPLVLTLLAAYGAARVLDTGSKCVGVGTMEATNLFEKLIDKHKGR